MCIISNIATLSNDNMGQSRHTMDIITAEVFEKLLEIIENSSQIPSLIEFMNLLRRLLKPIIDTHNFADNF